MMTFRCEMNFSTKINAHCEKLSATTDIEDSSTSGRHCLKLRTVRFFYASFKDLYQIIMKSKLKCKLEHPQGCNWYCKTVFFLICIYTNICISLVDRKQNRFWFWHQQPQQWGVKGQTGRSIASVFLTKSQSVHFFLSYCGLLVASQQAAPELNVTVSDEAFKKFPSQVSSLTKLYNHTLCH